LAAKKLDKLWDGWMSNLAESYFKTLVLLDDEKIEQAVLEYRKGYLTNVKKLYSEAAKTYPLRFSKAEHWCVWTKKLYTLSRQTEETLKKQDAEKALKLLEKAREHFYALHKETETFHCNDIIYEFRIEAAKKELSGKKLEEIMKRLEKAEPSCVAKEKPKAYAEAKNTWKKAIAPLLDDGQIESSEQELLRKTSEAFYRTFGIQYE
jgi:hypothetical protein